MNEEQRKKVLGEVQHRTITLTRESINTETRTIQLAFSSEEPVERWWGMEILDHTPQSVRLDRLLTGAPFLLQHDSNKHMGVVENARVDSDRIGRAEVRMSKSPDAEVIFQDIIDGIRTKISVGYMIHEMIMEKKDDKAETYRCTDWEPYEISLVSIPADNTVGVGRNLNNNPQQSTKESIKMDEIVKVKGQDSAAVVAPPVDYTKERERLSEIYAIYSRYVGKVKDVDVLRDQAIENGHTKEQFYWEVTHRMDPSKPVDTPDGMIGMSEKQVKQYSLSRAIAAQATKNWALAPFEADCSRAVAEKTGEKPQGFFVPFDVLVSDINRKDLNRNIAAQMGARQVASRDLTVASSSGGGYLVGTYNDATNFIDLLRNEMLFQRLGANVLTGLRESLTIPKLVTGATFYYASAEAGTGLTESNQVFGQLAMSPKIGGTWVDYSFKLMLQSNPSIDAIVQSDLAITAALGIDAAGFHGAGTEQPTGIASTSGVGSVTAASLGWDACIEFVTDVKASNAKKENCAFASTPTIWGLLKKREKFIGSGDTLIDDNDKLAGYPFFDTNQITAGYIFFGDFRQTIVGYWGNGVDILVDPYTASNYGIVRVRMLVGFDIGVRVPGAFSVASDAS